MQNDAPQTTEADEAIRRLKALAAANLGARAMDDEAIDAACESAIEVIERMQTALAHISALKRSQGDEVGDAVRLAKEAST